MMAAMAMGSLRMAASGIGRIGSLIVGIMEILFLAELCCIAVIIQSVSGLITLARGLKRRTCRIWRDVAVGGSPACRGMC
jgi:hypothetical protein